MKKVYKKPALVFESFKLSKSIAAGCGYVSHHSMNTCSVKTDYAVVFLTEDVCGKDGGYYGPEYLDGVCYDVPNDDRRVFSS